MFGTSKRISDLETRVASLALAIAELKQARDRSTDENLLKLIEQMQTDIRVTRASLRSVHGKIDVQKRGQTPPAEDAEDIQPWVELQQPNRSN